MVTPGLTEPAPHPVVARRKRPPGPKGRSIVGTLFELQLDPLGFLRAGHREFGDVILR